jgi:Icc-related predicted phosphoesterase
MPRIVCISDTHEKHDQLTVPPGDILIHAGDFTYVGHLGKVREFGKWLGSQPHKDKIVIAGNHDRTFEDIPKYAEQALKDAAGDSVHYLMDREVTVQGLRIYGSPWNPEFCDWAFNIPRGFLWEKWAKIPDGLDILVTHGPPSEDLGGIIPCENLEVGDPELLERIQQVRPRLHVCGHVHTGYGLRERYGIKFANAAVLDEAYELAHKPIVIDLPDRR